MEKIYIYIMFLSIALLWIIKLTGKKNKEKEVLYLINLFSIACDSKNTDWYGLMHQLESNSVHMRSDIKRIRIEAIKGTMREDNKKKNFLEEILLKSIEISNTTSLERGREYLRLSGSIIEGKEKRIAKLRKEVINAVGIMLAIANIFLVTIYFLKPLIDISNMNIF